VFGCLSFEGSDITKEHALTQAVTGIGRAPENDVRLESPTVSRFHARILSDEGGSRVIDLGSGNGTRVDGVELEVKVEKPLSDGALIEIGPFALRFHKRSEVSVAGEAEERGEVAGRKGVVEATVLFAPVFPARLAVTTPGGTTETVLRGATLTLGRDAASDIVVDSDAVSRRHARLDRRDSRWEITDLGSTNGLRFQGKPIQNMPLADGDVIWIGRSVALEFRDPDTARAAGSRGAPGLGWGRDAAGGPSQGRSPVFELPAKGALVLGRSDQADVSLLHPQVSRAHAQIVRRGADVYLEDLGSSAGTYVNGQLVREHRLKDGEIVRIGSSRLVMEQGRLRVVDEEGDLRIDALHLFRVVGKGLRILQDVSLSIYPQEFVAIVGASGSGKSTLLNALCGFRPANAGTVLFNGIDLYHNFAAYRNDLGYVPQDDIIHRELPVRRALDYAARLRMPGDTSAAERLQRVEEVLEDLDLRACAERAVRQLSGGQRKRVSIGVELLTRPSLFFLDEATSGLDPGTESQMMKLLRRLADQGRTVALVTHATKNVMTCDKVVFMARGGHLAYYGPPEEALRYFGVGDFDEIYGRLEQGDPKEWGSRFRVSRIYRENVEARLAEVSPPAGGGAVPAAVPAAAPSPAVPAPGIPQPRLGDRSAAGKGAAGKHRRVSTWRQFVILCQRYLDTIWRDKKTAALLLAIAPFLGALDFVVWKRDILDPQTGSAVKALTMLFMVSLITVLVGTITSVREIVKEDAIYRRERMVGLRVMPYVGSKVAVGFLFALYSAIMLFAFKLAAIDFSHLSISETMLLLVPLVLGTLAGVMWGLLVSAVAPSEDRAMLLVILVLVPQFVFSGGMVPLKDLGVAGKVMGWVTSSRWELGALATSAKIGGGAAQAPGLSGFFPPGIGGPLGSGQTQALSGSLRDQYGDIFNVNLPFYWGMALALSVVLLVVISILQKRKDRL
jgi:ABC-type multidrug transport system ATPase subunit/pSer/pThr/pTyr-binding forkhead associated (FHA) protein